MKAAPAWLTLSAVLLAAFAFAPAGNGAEQQAQARMYCLSLQFQHGIDRNAQYTLDLDYGELWPYSSSSYAAGITLNDYLGADTGYMLLPVPNIGDANKNGYPDFFESALAVDNVTTSGSYDLYYYGSGLLRATWFRGAGNSYGTCELVFRYNQYVDWIVFNLVFQVIEHSGPLSYTPGATRVTGRVELAQTDISGNLYVGPVVWVKKPANPFNELELQPGTWTNGWQQTQSYTNDVLERDIRWPTNYYGYVLFDDDFNPETPYPFDLWVLSIDDLNDTDGDGIPDFSDGPGGPALPRAPRLSMTCGETNLWLTIAGDVGHVHQVQEAPAIKGADWTTVWSQSLTNDPQVVSLPAPAAGSRFWRVIAQ